MKTEIYIDAAEGMAAASQGGADHVLTSGQEAGATYHHDRVRLGGTPGCPEYRRQAGGQS